MEFCISCCRRCSLGITTHVVPASAWFGWVVSTTRAGPDRSGSNWRCVQVLQWMYDEWFFLTPDLSLLRKAAVLVYVFFKLQLSACGLHVLQAVCLQPNWNSCMKSYWFSISHFLHTINYCMDFLSPSQRPAVCLQSLWRIIYCFFHRLMLRKD